MTNKSYLMYQRNRIKEGDNLPKDTFFNLNEEKQEKVVRSAIGQFAKNGYEKANIAIIARNAGIAKGSMYQYFENKKELFLYSVQWTIKFFVTKYSTFIKPGDADLFDYLYESSTQILKQIEEERELALFIQDVLLGKYSTVKDQSLDVMLQSGDDYILKMIGDGKANGSIRADMDDNILAMFMTGASMKIKEYILNKARSEEKDIISGYESYQKDIKAMLELLKNGMGEKNVY